MFGKSPCINSLYYYTFNIKRTYSAVFDKYVKQTVCICVVHGLCFNYTHLAINRFTFINL